MEHYSEYTQSKQKGVYGFLSDFQEYTTAMVSPHSFLELLHLPSGDGYEGRVPELIDWT